MAVLLFLKVKPATINDLDVLHEIERECFTIEALPKEQIARLLENPNTISLGAWILEEVAGFIIGSIEDLDETKAGHVYTLDIAVKHRRQGIGLRLLTELERIFTAKGVETCYLEVGVDNVAARELYRKQGYTEVDTLSDYYHKGGHGVRLVKRLKT
ncbi:MAG: GNAT family N-acetyltransferase [Candidatus Bathyarchaeota archaeon]|nr:GNAT family N-acetyltransferase [Candidatus Bathyarchaeota archaeon]MDH5732220.1 GNAT family N-acetyltransferase [Candidatus Bathyarchaeota archaeon]